MKRAKTLVSVAEFSVGSKEAPEAARIELRNLPGDMDVYASRLEELLRNLDEKLKRSHILISCWGSKESG